MLDQPQVVDELAQRAFRQLRKRSWKAAAQHHLRALLEHCEEPGQVPRDSSRGTRQAPRQRPRVRHAI